MRILYMESHVVNCPNIKKYWPVTNLKHVSTISEIQNLQKKLLIYSGNYQRFKKLQLNNYRVSV